ncbi:MAG: S1C family serine protease [Lachnospiraceae bacterium]
MGDEGYKFIEEKITHKKPNKIFRYIKKFAFIAAGAAVFGIVAAIFFNLTNSAFRKNKVSDDTEKTQIHVQTPKETPKTEPAKSNSSYNASDEHGIALYTEKYKNISMFCKSYEDMIVTVSEQTEDYDYFSNPVIDTSLRSGLIIKKSPERIYVLTTGRLDMEKEYHIYLEDNVQINAVQEDSDKYTGLLVLSADISGLNNNVKEGLREAVINKDTPLNIGDTVYAIGNPRGDMYSISYGYVCSNAIDNYLVDGYMTSYKTDMNVSDNSLGFVINSAGVVIGIVSDKLGQTYTDPGTLFGIAELREMIDSLMNGTERTYAGIIGHNVKNEYLALRGLKNGIYVSDISVSSPALEADVSVGDVIISIDGKAVNSVKEYADILSEYNVGDSINIERYRERARNNKYKTVSLVLGKCE